jgi:hypothetical protein
MFDPTVRNTGGITKYYESEETFRDMVGQIIALGIPEIALYYPLSDTQVPMFEKIARDTIPAMKAAYAAATTALPSR